MEALPPVDQSPGLIEAVDGTELLLQVPDESRLNGGAGRAVGGGFVIDLITDDGRIVAVMGGDGANHAFGVAQKIGIGDVHILADAIGGSLSIKAGDQNFRMFFEHPRRDGISGRAHDYADVGAGEAFEDTIHPGKFETAVFWLPEAPGGFSDADDVNPGLLHQGDVSFEAILGHVFFVEGRAIKESIHAIGGEALGGLR